ncbi:MAG: type I-D CRISPR-associated protein Cas7/Csc2 [Promethearchaeota archaeon]
MNMPEFLKNLNEFFVEKPRPILGAETLQILLIREIQDFTVLRTEETRELNTITIPLSIEKANEMVQRVVFLGSKQKAVETRYFRSLLNTITKRESVKLTDCYLKDSLCLKCPRCILYGAVKTIGTEPNIKHRVNYSSAFSLQPFESINTTFTFNAVDESSQKTGQALGTTYSVKPAAAFISTISLRSVTWKEFIFQMKTILAVKNYGAETRVRGVVRNVPIAIIGGWEEIITPLELTLELYDKYNKKKALEQKQLIEILEKYKEMAGFSNKVSIITGEELDGLVTNIASYELNKDFIKEFIKDAEDFRKEQKTEDKKSGK